MGETGGFVVGGEGENGESFALGMGEGGGRDDQGEGEEGRWCGYE